MNSKAIYHDIYNKLAKLISNIENLKVGYCEISKVKHKNFKDLDLWLSVLSEEKKDQETIKVISLTHYCELDNETVPDPETKIKIYTRKKVAEFLTSRNIYCEEDRPPPTNLTPAIKKQLNVILNDWLSRYLKQGHKFSGDKGVSTQNPKTDVINDEKDKEKVKKNLLQQYPYLIPVNGSNPLNVGAKNVRLELKKAFPNVKFSVRIRRYRVSNRIIISWADGVTVSKVEEITNKYMLMRIKFVSDCWIYRKDPFSDVFGSAWHVIAHRNITPKLYAKAAKLFGYTTTGVLTMDRCFEDLSHEQTNEILGRISVIDGD